MAAPASSSSSNRPQPHTASTTPQAVAGAGSSAGAAFTTNSCWHTDATRHGNIYPRLNKDDPTIYDAVVVGGGIVGVSTAYALSQAGYRVALVEARAIGTGTTGWSTAKLTAQQNLLYTQLVKMHGKEAGKLYGRMNMDAIDLVEKLDRELKLGSNFKRASHATWTSVEKQVSTVREEAELCKELGLPCELLSGEDVAKDLPASVEAKAAVLFTNQAVFNPVQYCLGLTAALAAQPGCVVHENTRIILVDEKASPHKVTVEGEGGGSLLAKHVVLATHMPILDRSLHFTTFTPSRSCCIAVSLTDASKLPKAAWISDESTPMRSMRVGDRGELIVAGESFEQGSVTDTKANYDRLEEWARKHFPVEKVTHRWSSMDYMNSTKIPFIGYLHRGCNTIYTATGMSKWGLANGVAAGSILRDLIVSGESALESNPYAKLVDARRWDLLHSLPGMAQAGVHTAAHLVMDHAKAHLMAHDIATLKRGEGGLVKIKGESVGAYLDEEGKYHLIKPVCTHMGCAVVFNQGDKVWDCPCHGSQFTVDGDVIQGPACKSLACMNHLQW